MRLGRTVAAAEHVVVACTLRSGSNLLCEVLRQNGYGEPKEWFQTTPDAGRDSRSPQLQLRNFAAAHAGTRWRGVKFDWSQLRALHVAAPGLPAVASLLRNMLGGRWIFLRRRNLAAQAVSLYAAQLTGAWMGEPAVDYDAVPQDFDAMFERFAGLAADEFAWDEFFHVSGIEPRHAYYEDLVAGEMATWHALMRHLTPEIDPGRIDLGALQKPPRQPERLRLLKTWFAGELATGRRPRSLVSMLDGIETAISRVRQPPSVDGLLGRFGADMMTQPGGFRLRKLDLRRDLRIEGSASLVERDHFPDCIALRLDPDAVCSFAVPATRVMLQFHAHPWSGVADIRFGEVVESLDLFSEGAETRYVIRDLPAGFQAPISVRASGAKHFLSEGREVWLQRVFVLDGRAG